MPPEPLPRQNERRFCNEFLEFPDKPWSSTYCKLPAGHDGDHAAHYPEEPEPETGADYSPHPNVGRLAPGEAIVAVRIGPQMPFNEPMDDPT